MTVADSTGHMDFPEQSKYVRSESTALIKYQPLEGVGGTPQTRDTYTVNIKLRGAVPKWAQNKQGVDHLSYMSTVRKRFDKSAEVDAASR